MEDMTEKIKEILSDKESMKQIQELAQMFTSETGGSTAEDTCKANNEEPQASQSGGSPDFDISKLFQLQSIMNSAQGDKTTDFLLALKPLLKEERQERVDRAVKILRLLTIWGVLRESGMLSDFF
ncbi:MAG: hypothetical protein ACI4JB_05120 [Porcipelethomonas sp.]